MLHFSDDNTSGMLQVEKKKPVKRSIEQKNELWKMYFDGSSSKEGAGIILVSPGGELISLMYKLEFVTTNNTSKYEALILGLKAANYMGIEQISIYGDSELVVQQVRDKKQVKQDLLKVYRNEVWDMIDNFFIAFNISFIPRDHNHIANSLSLAATHFRILKQTQLKYPTEVRYRPSVPDNIKQWRVFEDDLEIKKKLELTGEFSKLFIDQDQDEEFEYADEYSENEIVGHKIIELKGNFIPKGLVPLERIFSKDYILLKPTMQSSEEDVISCNIGTEEQPRMVKILKYLSVEKMNMYIKLLKEFVDIFFLVL